MLYEDPLGELYREWNTLCERNLPDSSVYTDGEDAEQRRLRKGATVPCMKVGAALSVLPTDSGAHTAGIRTGSGELQIAPYHRILMLGT